MKNLKLKATSGDMAKGGLSNVDTIIEVPYKYKKFVDTFLVDTTIYDKNMDRDW